MKPEDLVKLNARYKALLEEAKALAEQVDEEGNLPEEIAAQIDEKLGAADEIKAQIELDQRLTKAEEFQTEPAGTQAVDVSWRQAGPQEGMQAVDPKAWRSIEVERPVVDPVLGLVIMQKAEIRFHVPISVQGKGYPFAFEAYLHKGLKELGPEDYKTLTEGVDSAGGFTVPEDYQTELIRKIATAATIRSRARVAQTSRDIAKWPKLHYTTDDEYTSGVRLSWTGESPASATVHRATDPVFGLYSIPVHTAMASLPLSNDLIEDSAFDVAGISQELLAEAFILGENDAFLNGNGVSRPMGLLTQVDGDGPASVASGSATAILSDGLIDLWGALPSQYESNSVWLFNKATEVDIRQLKDATNENYLWPIYQAVGAFGPAPRELLGFPVMRDEFMPDVAGDAYPIIFGDLRGYLVLDRVGLSIQRLTELYAETNITLLLARKRVGGQCIEPWRIKAQKIAT
jgi:HK97 family phage major capsid protein